MNSNVNKTIVMFPLRLEICDRTINQESIILSHRPVRNISGPHVPGKLPLFREICIRWYPDECQMIPHVQDMSELERASLTAYRKRIKGTSDKAAIDRALKEFSSMVGPDRARFLADNADDLLDSSPLSKFFKKGAELKLLPDYISLYTYGKIGDAPGEEGLQELVKDIQIRQGLNLTAFWDKESPGSEWAYDFSKAVESGMGIIVTGRDQCEQLDKAKWLIAVGYKNSDEGDQILNELFTNNKVSGKMEILRQDMPTNNTEKSTAAYSSDAGSGQHIEPAPVNTGINSGNLLSTAFGLDPTIFDKVNNSATTEQRAAIAMSRLLWDSCTSEYYHSYMNYAVPRGNGNNPDPQMAADGTGTYSLDKDPDLWPLIRHQFETYVLGRGPFPSLRLGNNPYGILPVTSLERWKSSESDEKSYKYKLDNAMAIIFSAFKKKFLALSEQWDPGNVMEDEKFEHMVQVLQLNPVSYRADAQFMRPSDPNNGLDSSLHRLQEAIELTKEDKERAINETLQYYNIIATYDYLKYVLFGWDKVEDTEAKPGKYKYNLIYYLIDKFGLEWLDPVYVIIRKIDGGNTLKIKGPFVWPPSTQNYILIKLNDTKMKANLTISTDQRSAEFIAKTENGELNIYYELESSKIRDRLNNPNIIVPLLQRLLLYSSMSLENELKNLAERIANSQSSDELKKEYGSLKDRAKGMSRELKIINNLTQDEMNGLMFEVLDCFSHRLDAWITSLACKSLVNIDMDKECISRNSGLIWDESGANLIGVYGWLERPIKKKPETHEEYFQAPSMNQAVAGAILRNTALNGSPDGKGPFQINLSSSHVKKAVWFTDGLRKGYPAEELLGYRAERRLHEKKLDVYIHDLRQHPFYPLKGQENSQNSMNRFSHVLDGKAFMEDNTWSKMDDKVRYLCPMLSGENGADYYARVNMLVDGVNSIRSELKQLMDATSDIYMAETVYQTVQRNPAKIAACMDAMEGKNVPPIPEVISIPRTGYTQTQRVIYPFQYDPVSQNLNQLTNPRSIAEPIVANFCDSELTDYKETISKVTIASRNLYYFFSWDDIPGNDTERFVEFLSKEYPIDYWLKGKIENDGKTIRVSTENNFILLTLNDEKTKVSLNINNIKTDEFIVQTGDVKLKIYRNAQISFLLSPKNDLGIEAIDLIIGDAPELDVKSNKYHVPELEAKAKIYLWKILLSGDNKSWSDLWQDMKSDPILKPKIESFLSSPTAGGLNELTSITFDYDNLPAGHESSQRLSTVLEKASRLKLFLRSIRPLMPEDMVTKDNKELGSIIEQKIKGYKYLKERTRVLYESLLQDKTNLMKAQEKIGYLLNWDKIPGNDNIRLIEFLRQEYGMDWVEKENIKKSVDGNTISASAGYNSFSLILNTEKTKVDLRIKDVKTSVFSGIDEFIAKMENGNLTVYLDAHKPLKDLNAFMANTLQDSITRLNLYGLKEALTILPGISSQESRHQVMKLLQTLAYKMDALENEASGRDIVEVVIENKGLPPVSVKLDDQDKLVKLDNGAKWVEIADDEIALKYNAINKLISESVAYLKNRTAGDAMMVFPPFCPNADLRINSGEKTPAGDDYKVSGIGSALEGSFGEYANVRKNMWLLKEIYMGGGDFEVYSDIGVQRSLQEALSIAKLKLGPDVPPITAGSLSIPYQFFVDKHFIVPKNGMKIINGNPIAGFIVDEWTDFIPNTKEFTALALKYETPKSEAPQAILIAVPPAINDKKEWEIGTVAEIIADTIDLMRMRAASSEDVVSSNLGYLLPCMLFKNGTLKVGDEVTTQSPVKGGFTYAQ
jgi:hypothetical protein